MLFVTWDGPGTTYYETLFLPLLAGALEDGDTLQVLQFTWGDPARSARSAVVSELRNVRYEPIDLGGRGRLAAAAAAARGVLRIRRASRRDGVDVVIARSVLPGVLTLCSRWGNRSRRPVFVYDADGLPADERAEFAGWSRRGIRYWMFRSAEWISVRRAALVLTRTQRAVDVLVQRTRAPRDKFALVVNGTPLSERPLPDPNSRADTRRSLGIPADGIVVAYVGSIGSQYLPEQMVKTLRTLRTELGDRLWCLILTSRTNHEALRRLTHEHSLDQVIMQEVPPAEVGGLLASADLGLAYRRATLSQAAVQPIKVGEYLGAGVPVAYTGGVGDLDNLLDDSVAMVVDPEDEASVVALARWIEKMLRHREEVRAACRSLAQRAFSVTRGIDTYRGALRRVDRPRSTNGR